MFFFVPCTVQKNTTIFSLYARIIRNKIKFDLQTQITNFILIRQVVSDIKEADAILAVACSFLYNEDHKKRELLCAMRGSVQTKHSALKS